jgi:hypothetical protein
VFRCAPVAWIEHLATNQVSKNYKPFLWCRLREPPLVSALLNSTELVPNFFPNVRTWVRFPSPAPYGTYVSGRSCAFRSLLIQAISHFRRSILARSCRDSGTRLFSRKHRFPWASMTGQSVNPEQPRGRGATRLELGRKSNEEPNLAPTYTEYRFLENVNRRGQKSGSLGRRHTSQVRPDWSFSAVRARNFF